MQSQFPPEGANSANLGSWDRLLYCRERPATATSESSRRKPPLALARQTGHQKGLPHVPARDGHLGRLHCFLRSCTRSSRDKQHRRQRKSHKMMMANGESCISWSKLHNAVHRPCTWISCFNVFMLSLIMSLRILMSTQPSFFSCDHSLLPHHFMCSTYEHANLANQIYYKIEKLTIDRATTKQATAYWEKSSKFPCPYVNI
jgi:hypothetical protein